MISPKPITRKDAGDARVTKAIDSYYQEEKDDYYTREKQPSEWYGALAEDLGLAGNVEKADFQALLEGKHGGNTLRDSSFKKKSANDRLGLDLTFNAPKSVSIQALVAGDKRLIEAHHEAVKESLAMIEANAQARKKVNGKTRIENTNHIAVAMFRHDTNRNNDPHLHTHSVVLNITKRGDGAYRALHNDKLVKKIPEASQAYQTNLAKKCKELGYDIRINDNGTFDLAHISREQIVEFSTRSKQIEETLAKRGLTRETATREERQMANFVTKQRKRLINKETIQEKWAKTAKKMGIDKILSPQNVLKPKSKEKANEQEQQHERGNRRTEHGRDHEASHARDSKQDQRQNNQPSLTTAPRSRSTSEDSLHELPSGNVASVTEKKSKMLLSNNSQLQLLKRRANAIFGLRWGRDSSSNGTGVDQFDQKFKAPDRKNHKSQDGIPHINRTPTIDGKKYETMQDSKHEKESLKDMLEYEAPTSELTEQWQTAAKTLGMNLEPGKTYNEPNKEFSGEKLISHVVRHLSDKKVDMTRDEVIRETLIKGMGEVGATQANQLLDDYIAKGEIIKAEPLYKTSADKTDSSAKTVKEWQKMLTKGNAMTADMADKAIERGIKEGRLLPLDDRYVTKHDLASEKNILQIMEQGRGIKKAYYNEAEAEHILNETTLNDGQKAAARLIMTTNDRVVGIQGYAGVGKSYTLSQVLPQVEKAGGSVHVFAPYGSQVKSLKADGHEASTVAKLLGSKSLQDEITKDSLIVVDEAGVLANKDAEKLLQLTKQKNCKLVLLGDIQQTKAINAGKPFDLLQDNGMSMATIDDIQRQKDEVLKKAVHEAAIDQPVESVQTLAKSVYEIPDKIERLDILVDKYMSYTQEERKNTLVVTGTNEDKDYINDKIREELGIKGQGVVTQQLKRIDMSKAEMKHARYYKENTQIEIQVKPKDKQLEKNKLYTVVGSEKHLLIIKDDENNEFKFNPAKEKIAVYETRKFEVSKGDKLRVRKGDNEIGTVTGDKLVVEAVTKNSIIAKDEKTGTAYSFDTTDKNHLDHDYCSTVHSSQGLTVDNVIININTKSKTTSKEVYYVAVSRAKHQAFVVTDNINKLPGAIAKGAEKHSAYEMVGSKEIPKNKYIQQHEIQHKYEEIEL